MRTYLIALAALLGMMNAEVININANGDPSAAANAIKDAIDKAGAGQAAKPAPTGDANTEASDDDGDAVTTLTGANFESKLNDGSIWMVEFYAPWCGHCKQLAPVYESAASKLLLAHGGKVKLGKMDATGDDVPDISKYDVSGYPTLVFMLDGTKGDHYPYEGGRLEENMVEHMDNVASGTWKPPKNRVVTLTTDSFDSFVKGEKITLVEFYAPWCGHCKKLAPAFTKAAAALWPTVKIAMVDATENQELATKYSVTGYPTLKVFRNGDLDSPSDYEGERDAESIAKEMRDLTSDAAKKYDTIFDTEMETESDEHFVMGWFETEDDAGYKLYQKVASSMRKKYQFGYATNSDVIANYGGAKAGTVTAFKSKFYLTKYEQSAVTFKLDAATDEDALKGFVESSAKQLLQRNDPTSKVASASHVFPGRPLLTFYADLPSDKDFRAESAAILASVAEVATKFKGKVEFCHADASANEKDMTDYKIQDQDQDVKAVYLGEDKDAKYVMEDDGDLEEFVTAALAGNLTPYVKTEPKPKKNKGPVKVVVGSTFDEIVNDASNDVLVEFYAPWCGHCKTLEPIYKKTAKKLKSVAGIVLAKIDATANDYPSLYDVSGFPTIFFVAKDKKDAPVVYDGDRDQKGILKFLRAESSAEIPKPKKTKKKKSAKAESKMEMDGEEFVEITKEEADTAAAAAAAAATAAAAEDTAAEDDFYGTESDEIPKDEL